MIFGLNPMPYLIAAVVAGLTLLGVGTERYLAGRKAERAVQQAMIARMVEQHRAALDAANARVDAANEQNRLRRQGADHVQEQERARTRALLAAAVADRNRMRDQLAAFAAGREQAGDDSVAACHDRAAALGRVLGEALQAHAECSAAAEDLAAGTRALRAAWPVGVEAPGH